MTKPDTVELPVVAQALLVKPRKSEYWHSCRECEGQWLSSHKRDIACPFCALIHAAPRLQAAEEAIERVRVAVRVVGQSVVETDGEDSRAYQAVQYIGQALTPPNEEKGDG